LMNSIFSTNDLVCIPNDSNSCRNSFVFIDDGSISRNGSESGLALRPATEVRYYIFISKTRH
jgi:hypothetical protein